MTFQRLSIIGVGLLGGSIGLAVKSKSSHCSIMGYGHRPATLLRARERGAIDQIETNAAQAARDADLVILCTPVGVFPHILAQIAPILKEGAIITDVGSTKRSVVRWAAESLPKSVHFIGSHPMAGSEKQGIEAARSDLFEKALCITTPNSATNSDALGRLESFWQELGMRTTRLSADDHDRMLAEVSHLPHMVAAALVAMQSDQALPLAGKGFLDATRIAGGDGALWRDILLDNVDNLRGVLGRLRSQLDRLEQMLNPQQSEELRQWLDHAANKRRSRSESSNSGE